MSRSVAVLLAAVLAAGAAGQVIEATEETFDKLVHDNEEVGVVMAVFYAPWCTHCQKFAPEFAAAEEQLRGVAHFVQVDATKETRLATKHDVKGYPTIKTFVKGHEHRYEEGRTAKDIVDYVSRYTGPPVAHLTTQAELSSFKVEHIVFAAGFFRSKEDPEAVVFEEIATKNRHSFVFVAVWNETVAAAEGIAVPGLAVYKHFDEQKDVMDGGFHPDDMIPFIQRNAFPLLDRITPDNARQYFLRGLPLLWLFVDSASAEETAAAKAAVEETAKGYRGRVSAVWMDGGHHLPLMHKQGLTGKKFPAVALDDGTHYPMDESLAVTPDTVRAFMQSWETGELRAHLHTEPEPESLYRDGVVQLVSTTFKEWVLDEERDVVVRLCTPGEKICQSTRRDFVNMARNVAAMGNVVAAEMDHTKNDIGLEGFFFHKLPAVFLVRRATNEVVRYAGAGHADALTEWVRRETQ